MVEQIVYPPWISKKMTARFDNLNFFVDCDGFVYSLKSYNDKWDFQTEALWLRSIGMNPEPIAKKLGLNVNTLKNKEFLGLLSLDYPGKNYSIRRSTRDDWSDRGFVDSRGDRYTYAGGSPMITDDDNEIYARSEMDGELQGVRHDNHEDPDEIEPPKDPYKEYYGDYKDERTNTATDPE